MIPVQDRNLRVRRDDDHRYWLHCGSGVEREALSVTRTIVEANLVDDTYFTDVARGRGKIVHAFVERMAIDSLADVIIPEYLLGWLTAFRRFLDRYAPTVNAAEVIAANVGRLVAGTIDLDLVLMGGAAIVEVKTSDPSPWHGLQTAPYAWLRYGPHWLDVARFGLHLKPSGGFRLKQHERLDDLDRFLNAADLLHWRIEHGTHGRPFGRRANGEYGDTGLAGNVVDGTSGEWRTPSD